MSPALLEPPRAQAPGVDRRRVAPITSALRRLRARARARLIAQAVMTIAAWAALALAAAVVLDALLRLPAAIRWTFWGAGILALAWGVRGVLWPAVRFRPALTELALRVERAPKARAAGLDGLLASALELARQDPSRRPDPHEVARREAIVDEAVSRLGSLDPSSLLLTSAKSQRGALQLLVALLPILVSSVLWPGLVTTGMGRVLTPWRNVQWPKRTELADATGVRVHPLGVALPLRAALLRTNQPPGKTDVWVRWRVDPEEGPALQGRSLMTFQSAPSDAQGGELYERLIEPETLRGGPGRLEYWFETPDDQTERAQVRLVEPPAIAQASAEITPPSYARALAGQTDFLAGVRPLGPGRSQATSVGPILSGSRVRLALALNREIPAPLAQEQEAWIRSVFSPAAPPDAGAVFSPSSWELSWTLRAPAQLTVGLRDADGIASIEESVYRFEVVEDKPPAAAVVEPAQDESVLPTAVLDVAGEGRDDLGLEAVWLTSRRGETSAAELARLTPPEGGRGPLRASAQLDLSQMGLNAGEELVVRAHAADSFAAAEGELRVADSPPRRLRVIGQGDFVKQILDQLQSVRSAAQRLDGQQEALARRLARGEAPGELRQGQEAIDSGLGVAGELIDRAIARVERNALPDRSVAELLKSAAQLTGQARAAAARGARELALAGMQRPGSLEEAASAQEEVRDQLARLVDLLDRGQEGWAARQGVERLAADQARVEEAMGKLAPQVAGKTHDQLTPEQAQELERLARWQEELAQRARVATEAMEEKAGQMEALDPGQAQALRRSAAISRQEQLEELQAKAGAQTRENQLGPALEAQQKSRRALEQMLKELESTAARRDEALRRLLSDLITAIRTLIDQQQRELAALAAAQKGGGARGLDRGVMRLSGNTADLARSITARDLAEVAKRLASASQSQDAAVIALRGEVADLALADAKERESLTLLNEAHDLARKQDEQAQKRGQDQKRGEIRKAYEQALQKQRDLRRDTEPFLGAQLDRRRRAALRALGQEQDKLRQELADLRGGTEGLSDAKVFALAHDRLDRLTSAAARAMSEGKTEPDVGRGQSSAVGVLTALVSALQDQQKQRDAFRDDAGGGGGGGGGGEGGGQEQGLIPPLAELKLLRAMQDQAAAQTRELAQGPADQAAIADLAQLQGELARQAKELGEKTRSKDQ